MPFPPNLQQVSTNALELGSLFVTTHRQAPWLALSSVLETPRGRNPLYVFIRNLTGKAIEPFAISFDLERPSLLVTKSPVVDLADGIAGVRIVDRATAMVPGNVAVGGGGPYLCVLGEPGRADEGPIWISLTTFEASWQIETALDRLALVAKWRIGFGPAENMTVLAQGGASGSADA